MKFLFALCVLCFLAFPAVALDREAFTFTKYDLKVRVEPEQQRLGVRGRITLRNDSSTPQKNLALQISSTLDWRAITLDRKPVQFETHSYTSDIDHTGALSEAMVTLPHEVPPRESIELEIGYEGVIPLDATRLTRIGVPEDKAKHIDWDEIGKSFTAVRGIGYVAWYPIGTEAASLSEGNSVEETVARWKARHDQSRILVKLSWYGMAHVAIPSLYCDGATDRIDEQMDRAQGLTADCSWAPVGESVPTLVIARYESLTVKDRADIRYLEGQKDAVDAYAEVVSQIDPVIPRRRDTKNLQILGLPDEGDSPFVVQGMLLTPLKSPLTNEAELSIVYAMARQLVLSARAWIEDGLSHYAQAAFIEQQKGRQAALDYLEAHQALLVEAEKQTGEKTASDRSLITAPDDLYLQIKSTYVWWMLRDMIGGTPTDALLNYHASDDKTADYMQKLLEKQYHRDLQWFFDDWVYHDRGLPDFRVASVFSTPIPAGGFLVTVEIENLGSAGAEVPIILKTEGAELRKRLAVRGKSKASVRIETQSAPTDVTVNDGSVPESDVSNNTYKIETPAK
jgi:hypothetical protein